MRSMLAILTGSWLFGVLIWACVSGAWPASRRPTTAKMVEVQQIESKLFELLSFRTAIDEDFAQVVGVASFTTETRIYPLHRHPNGDLYESRGLDDFDGEALDYDMSVTCQPSNGERYLFTVEMLGRTEQRTSPELVERMKRAMVRRAALNFADSLIYIQHYADLKPERVEEYP